MNPRIGLVHALYDSIAPLQQAFDAHWPDAEVVHLFDGSLYADYRHHGEVTPQITQRVATLIRHSRESGAAGILFSGSLFGPAVEAARVELEIPVLTAYESMIEAAFRQGGRLALLATVADSLQALETDVRRHAAAAQVPCAVEARHVPGALDALQAGNRAEHDQRIAACAAEMSECDALLLAQHSMGPASGLIPSVPGRVVLTSPETAVMNMKSLVAPPPAAAAGP